MDRRNTSDDGRPPREPANPDVFDDEFALDPDEDDFMPSVSDGFRPWDSDRQDHDRDNTAHNHDDDDDDDDDPFDDSHQSQPPPAKPADTDLRRLATRNSTAKVPGVATDSRQAGTHTRGPSAHATPLRHRESVSSTASFATMGRSESPFANGPSHPYGMYPQDTMPRTSSIVTPPPQQPPAPQPSIPLQRPAHPYEMFPQTAVETEPPLPPALPQLQTAIPLGFPGLPAGYHRQIGPDGEEQDIIGPDGHTEQLPPYSRYPEEGPTKAAIAAEASATPVEGAAANPNAPNASNPVIATNDPIASPVSPISPAPAPLSNIVPAVLPQQRPETQTGNLAPTAAGTVPAPASNSASASLLASEEEGISEKEEPARSVKGSWRSKKLWGRIPIGVALVLLTLVVIFAIILGAALGTFVARKDKDDDGGKDRNHNDNNKDDPASQISGPSHTLFDASPIPTPTDLPPLPTGIFALPLGIPQESSPGCLTQANQYAAWSCKLTFAPLLLTVGDADPEGDEDATAFVSLEPSSDPNDLSYGLQPPSLELQPMQLVSDADYKAYGAAFHFTARYDKIVILKPDEFAAGSGLRKRQEDKTSSFNHRFRVMPGDFPWYCVWNETYIEGYLYAYDNSTAATFTSSPTPLSVPIDTEAPTPMTSSAEATPSPQPVEKRDEGGDMQRMPPYPKIVKVEERRLPGSPQPYCQKMMSLNNGQLAPASGSDRSEGPIMVYLQEDTPSFEEFYEAQPEPTSSSESDDEDKARRAFSKRTDPSDACHCQWMFQ